MSDPRLRETSPLPRTSWSGERRSCTTPWFPAIRLPGRSISSTIPFSPTSKDRVESRIYDNVAILSYDAKETETIFSQNLRARYHITDTWLRRDGSWQIVASQAHRYYEDPATGKADLKKFPDFIGAYELVPGQTRTVIAEGDNLFVERKGKRDQLLPETSELFFRKGIEGRILFRYDKGGKVDALIDRRNNEDVVWRKVAGK